ncbi:MAG: PKD domain-containing protein [Flavobacteriales bacterium]|nr:PKD domain-containing protein [Flavobacteriales bacterium]
MILRYKKLKISTTAIVFLLSIFGARAQCPHVFDFYGQVNDDPYWYSCSGNNFTFNLSTPDTWNGYSIDWGDGSPVTSGASWSPPTFQSHVYTATVDTFTVTITETSSGCVTTGVVVMEEASSASIQIPVGGLTQACAPQMMEFINSSTNVSETTIFTWDFGDGSPILVFDYTNWNQTIQHTYEVGTVTCETVVTLTAENYCNVVQGGHSTATFDPIRIWDLDDPSITASATLLCYPDTTVTFTNTTYRNCLFQGNIYQRYEYWNFGDYWGLGHDSIIDWTPWPPTFPHTMHYPGIGSYTVELLDSNFCGIAPTSITIQIVPPPVAAIAATPDTVCVGETITFLQQSSGGANVYKWNLDTGMGWMPTGSGNITYIYNSPGTYNVGAMVGISGANGCTDTAWVQVVVLPSPTVDIIPDVGVGCDSLTTTLTVNTTNATTWDWTLETAPFTFSGQNPPSIFMNAAGNYDVDINVSSLNGCTASDHVVLHVYDSPVVDFNVFDLCEGEIATFQDMTTYTPGDDITDWDWDFGDGGTSTDQSPDYQYASAGTYLVTLNVNTANCSGTDTMSVLVDHAPLAQLNSNIVTGCSPLTVQFFNESDSAFVYQWSFSDGYSEETFELDHTFLNTSNTDTTYMITLTALNAFGCGSSDTMYVTVHPGAVASFLDNANPPGCSPFEAYFTNTSQNAVSYLWDLGDGTTSNLVNPTNMYINTSGVLDSYDITLIAYSPNGCNDTTTQTIIVYPLAVFDFTIAGAEGCAPLTTTMPFIQGVQVFNWDFGDGSVSPVAMPTHMFQNTSDTTVNYTVELIGSSAFGCTDTASAVVTVFPSPVAQFTVNQDAGCGPLTIDFTNLSIHADSYTWDYGDGTFSSETDTVHSHTYTNPGTTVITRTIVLTATTTDGCTNTFSLNIQVYPELVAAFDDPGVYCSPVTINFVNTSINATSYAWDFGNGLQSVTQNPAIEFTNNTGAPLSYTITMVASSMFGCSDTVTHDITVNPSPLADFTVDVIAGCSPVEVNITNNTVFASNLLWEYGDGTDSSLTDTLQQHTFYNSGSVPEDFEIHLTATSPQGCISQHSVTITTYPVVIAEFNDPGQYCSPATVTLINQSENAISYQWDFDNGIVSVMSSPTSVFDNNTEDVVIYDITLIATSSFGCVDTAVHPLVINPTPVAEFTPDVFSGCSPLTIEFANTSLFVDVNNWNYGDGVISSIGDSLHQHTFVNTSTIPVTYDVELTTLTAEGCSDMASISIVVYPAVQAGFGDPGVHCSPVTVSFTNSSIGAVGYQWEFSNGLTSVLPEPTTYYSNSTGDPITYPISLIAVSQFGCTDTVTQDILINPTPVAGFTPDLIGGCSPLTVTFSNTSVNADIYAWSFGDGALSDSSSSSLSHIYENNSADVMNFNVVLTTTSVEGCSSQANATIQVYPHVTASFMEPGSHYSPVNVSFINTSENAIAYNWDFGNSVQSIMENPSVYFANPADTSIVLNVQLMVTSPFGCSDVAQWPLTIHPTPIADFMMSESAACEPSPVTITNNSQVATIFNWNYGDGQTSSEAGLQHVHQFAEPLNGSSTYNIVLTATTEFGCVDTSAQVFSLYPEVFAVFAVDTIGCSPFNALFSNQSVGAVSYQWLFGDSQVSQLTTPAHTYTTGNEFDQDFEATLIATNLYGCTDTTTQTIHVMHSPLAVAQIDTMAGCYPTVVTFYNGSIGADSFVWTYGTGQTSTTDAEYHDYQYINVTSSVYTYPISLIATTDYGCSDQSNLTIDIAPEITADFYSIEEGCSPLQITFDNTSDGGDSYLWDFGDGDYSTDYEPTHTFFNWATTDTSYQVTFILFDSFGCSDTTSTTIHVYANPIASFDVSPDIQLYPDATITIDNTTIGGELSYNWDMDDGNELYVAEPGSYTYLSWGEYTIQLIVTNGSCSDTAYRTIEILPPPPVANFEGPAEGCVPLTVSFTNLSENNIFSNWLFGDGGASTATNPVYTYYQPGTYTVSLVVMGADGTTDQMVQEQIIQVYPRAQAAFTVNPNEVNVPGEPVYCLNLSQNATSYQWDFGDGNTSVEENPLYYYQAEGDYDIQLIAENEFGCPDTTILPGVVHASAAGLIHFPNAFTPNTIESSGGIYDAHSFDNDVFFPMHNGVVKYQLQIFNKWGEMLFESNDVNRGWDGYYRGSLVKQDVYVWKVRATFVDGQNVEQSGDVTLIVK